MSNRVQTDKIIITATINGDERSFLADEVKTDTMGVVIRDGSGLSGLSRVSAAVFVDVLKHMARTAQWEP